MTLTQSIITIAIITLGTMITRFLPFVLFPENKELPNLIKKLSITLPYAIIAFLVIYCLKDAINFNYNSSAEIIAILFIFILHKWKKNTLISITGGTIIYMVLVQNVF